MSVTPETVWSNARVLTVTNTAADDIPIAGIREVSIMPAYEHTELYTMDSNHRENAKRYEHNVNVEITYALFSLDMVHEWLGGEGSTATASQDTSDPTLFDIEDVSTADGQIERTSAVEDMIIPEFPVVDGSYGEFEEYGITGSGKTVSVTDTSV